MKGYRYCLVVLLSGLYAHSLHAIQCLDTDDDGICDLVDVCERVRDFSGYQPDSNGDGVGDSCASALFFASSNNKDLIKKYALRIGDGVTIGGNVAVYSPLIVGDNAVIAGTTNITGGISRPSIIGNNSTISAANLSSVVLGNSVKIYSGSNVYYANLGDNVVIKAGSTVTGRGQNSSGLSIGSGTVTNSGVNLSLVNSTIGSDVQIKTGVDIQATFVKIGDRVKIGYTNTDPIGNGNISIGDATIIGDDVTIGADVVIGKRCYIKPNTFVPDGTVVKDNSSYPPG